MQTVVNTAASTAARAMAQAAAVWLRELDHNQRKSAWWGPPGSQHESERRRWFYTPTDHGGLSFNQQVDWQQRNAMMLLAAGLSPGGYDLVATIMGTENILDRVEGFSSEFHTRRGRDPSRYYLRVFGDPEGSDPWGWRFGGHHISLNFLIVDGEVRSTTPRFFGLDPAVTTFPGGAQLSPLGGFQSAGRNLVASLSDQARSAAILLERAPADIVMGNRSSFEEAATMMRLSEIFRRRPGDGQLIELLEKGGAAREVETGYSADDHDALSLTTQPKGLSGAELEPLQKALLDRLVATYHEGLAPGLAPAWDVDRLHFAWAGPIDIGAPNYYRVQGDDLLIEWDNTARHANHAHAVVRHPANDFGGDALRLHHQGWHQSPTQSSQR